MKKIFLIIVLFIFICDVKALNSIKINNENLSPFFDKDIYVYNYYTNNDKVKISVDYDMKEDVKGYGVFDINDGLNEFIISCNDKEYKVNVFRNYKDEKNDFLVDLSIKNYDFSFNKDIFVYSINIDDEDSLDIEYELSNENMIVNIIGNGNFNSSKNVIKVDVMNKDYKKISEYTINVYKTIKVSSIIENDDIKEMSSIEKEIVIILLITISLLLIFGYFYLLFIKKLF